MQNEFKECHHPIDVPTRSGKELISEVLRSFQRAQYTSFRVSTTYRYALSKQETNANKKQKPGGSKVRERECQTFEDGNTSIGRKHQCAEGMPMHSKNRGEE